MSGHGTGGKVSNGGSERTICVVVRSHLSVLTWGERLGARRKCPYSFYFLVAMHLGTGVLLGM